MMMYKRKWITRIAYFCLTLILLIGCGTKGKKDIKKIEGNLVQNAEDIVFGNDSTSNTVFLYASYNCQYCRYFFSRTFPGLNQDYLSKGLVKVVVKFIDFGDDPHTRYALKAASCIYRYGSYQKFHELLLADPAIVETEKFRGLVDDILAENSDIAECFLNMADTDFLKENLEEFRQKQFTGTPTMVINSHVYTGFVSYEKIDAILKKEFDL